jgi:hypothetical protein
MVLHAPQPQTTEEYLIEIYGGLARMSESVDILSGRIDNLINGNCKIHGERIEKLEHWQIKVTAVSAVVGAVGGSVLTIATGLAGDLAKKLLHI